MQQNSFPYETLAPRSFSLAGRTALVTGAAGHLGRAISKGLAQAGASVTLVGRNAAKLESVVEDLRSQGHQAKYTAIDLSDTAAVTDFADTYVETEGSLDILVNNAYSGPTNTLAASTPEQYRDSYNIAVVAAAELVRALTPAFRQAVTDHGDASVINIASMYGHISPDPAIYGDSGQNSPPYYSASKGALIQYSRYAAVHLAKDRIRVNSISPGPFPPLSFREDKPDFYGELVQKVPMNRIGVADDMIGPVVFLASSNAQYVTGINLCVDGGWTSW